MIALALDFSLKTILLQEQFWLLQRLEMIIYQQLVKIKKAAKAPSLT